MLCLFLDNHIAHSIVHFQTLIRHHQQVKNNVIDEAFKSDIISKGTVIQKVNQFSNRILFIESGLLRVFYVDDGKDITHFFFEENHFVAPILSIYQNTPERYEWESIETCQVRVIAHEDFLKLEDQFPDEVVLFS